MLITRGFDDKDVDGLIEHFRDKERRKAFFKEYKELEMLYEIISPDAFLRPYLDDYATLSGIYAVVRKAYAKGVQPDREFLHKTNDLVQRHIDTDRIGAITQFVEINPETLKVIREQKAEYNTKVINLVKSIEKAAAARCQRRPISDRHGRARQSGAGKFRGTAAGYQRGAGPIGNRRRSGSSPSTAR